MPAGQMTANFFRILYVVFFVFSFFLVLFSFQSTVPLVIIPGLFEIPIPDLFTIHLSEIFNIVDYIMLFVQELIKAFAGLAFSLVTMLASAKSTIPFIGDLDFVNLNPRGLESAIASFVDPQNNFFPHSLIEIDLENPNAILDLIADFQLFFGATTIFILLPVAVFLYKIGNSDIFYDSNLIRFIITIIVCLSMFLFVIWLIVWIFTGLNIFDLLEGFVAEFW